MVERLCVPLTHSLRARNWNWASSGCPFTASRVANRVAMSTPLTPAATSVLVMVCSFWVGGHDDEPDARSAAFPRPSLDDRLTWRVGKEKRRLCGPHGRGRDRDQGRGGRQSQLARPCDPDHPSTGPRRPERQY